MLKLLTPVVTGRSKVDFSYSDKILVLGSCFADNIGEKLSNASFDVMVNPFGTLYNPLSIANALSRLESAVPFSEEDCVKMGSGSELYCSFSHHTSFARKTPGEWLSNANASLSEASKFWKEATKVIVTLGTAWCFFREGEAVANCLKRDREEFTRMLLGVGQCSSVMSSFLGRFASEERRFIFTVSPIRHMADGAHGNQVSKATLLLALENAMAKYPAFTEYFPAYEIVLDELRDYRFYSEDLVHPSPVAVDYLWERFCDFALREGEGETLKVKEKEYRRSLHRPLHP